MKILADKPTCNIAVCVAVQINKKLSVCLHKKVLSVGGISCLVSFSWCTVALIFNK